jgi:hypothetical protein
LTEEIADRRTIKIPGQKIIACPLKIYLPDEKNGCLTKKCLPEIIRPHRRNTR